MSNPDGKVCITFRLDPGLASDRLALATLQRWYQRGHKLNRDNDGFDFFRLQLHKDIYLSGLYLSLLDPGLVKYFSSNLQLASLTPDFLYKTLKDHQVMPDVVAPAPHSLDPAVSDELAARIADRLHSLLNTPGETTRAGKPNEQLQNQVNVLPQQLKEQGLPEPFSETGPGTPVSNMNTVNVSPSHREMPSLHDLSQTAVNVRKVRAKGVF